MGLEGRGGGVWRVALLISLSFFGFGFLLLLQEKLLFLGVGG